MAKKKSQLNNNELEKHLGVLWGGGKYFTVEFFLDMQKFSFYVLLGSFFRLTQHFFPRVSKTGLTGFYKVLWFLSSKNY